VPAERPYGQTGSDTLTRAAVFGRRVGGVG